MSHEQSWAIRLPEFQQQDENDKVPSEIRLIKQLNALYEFRYNVVTLRTEIRDLNQDSDWIDLNDRFLDTLVVRLRSLNMSVTTNVLESIFNSKYVKEHDPILHYFETLPTWDGTDYIAQLSSTVTTKDSDTWNRYLTKWLVGLVRSAITPGITNQQMLVFRGDQGIGKTRWISRLLPDSLKKFYFTGQIRFEDQVFMLKLGMYILIFLDELDSYKDSKQALIKSIITQDMVKVRLLFNSYETEVPRRASFIAAINDEAFLHDLTGSRRYLVVDCEDITAEHDIDMNLVFTQAYHLAMDKSFVHFFNKEETKKIEKHNSSFKIKCTVELLIEKYYEPCEKDAIFARIMTATEILDDLFVQAGYRPRCSPHKLGAIMKSLGFQKLSRDSGKEKRSGYLLKLIA